MADDISIANLLTWAYNQLQADDSESDSESALLESHVLMQHASGLNRVQLILQDKNALPSDQCLYFKKCILARKKGKPIAYIIGVQEFWSMPFYVNEHTLIPRPDTEVIIEQAITYIERNEVDQVLDLGTGSGIIAITLAKKFPAISFVAIDFSAEALNIAKANAQLHDCSNIDFYQSDWFAQLPQKYQSSFGLIVSNPPYIEANDEHLQQGDLRFEPISALASGDNGLQDIANIIEQSPAYLTQNATLMVEHGFNQGASVKALFLQKHYGDVTTYQDISNHDRVTAATFMS